MKKLFKTLFSLNPTSITVSLTFLVMAIFVFEFPPILHLIELKTFDMRFLSRGTKEPHADVVMAVIDEKSLDTLGRWPWPRSTIARLIDVLSKDGAKVIGFDIIFSEPDENSNLKLISEFDEKIQAFKIKNDQLMSFLGESKIRADNDLTLADAIKKAEMDVVLGYFFHMSQQELGFFIDDEEIENQLERLGNSKYPLVRYEDPNVELESFLYQFHAYAPEGNLKVLTDAAEASGFFNMLPDPDGVVRRIPLMILCGEELFMPLSIQSVWHYLDRPETMVKVDSYGMRGIQMGERFIPTAENGQMLINYLGPVRTFPHYSITDIINGKLPEGTFKGKIVLVGATSVGIYDLRNTPFSPVYPGMEIHATVIDNILKSNFLHKPFWTKIYDLLAILILGVVTGLVIPRIKPLLGVLFSSGLFVLHIFIANWFFKSHGLWINIVYPLIALALVYMALTVYHYLVEQKNKRFLHATFSSYLSPELIEEMVTKETMPELGGEARILTAYFTDIQSFSTFSEKLTAHQLVELLNEYLTAMTDILIEERGTLDKYEGDAIVAFFGAPLYIPDHALRACRVAVAMQNSLLDLREKWASEKQLSDEPHRNTKNFPPEEWAPGDKWPKIVHEMKMRIGVNTGEIVVGNMGSSMRMNYTMMGDSVNLAARLEEGAKQFGIYTSVSEYTMNSEYVDENGERGVIRDAVEARFIDNITVMGKSEPVKIYEICAMKGGLTEKEKELFEHFGKGMKHYHNTEWDAAIEYFTESLKIERVPDGKTTPSEVFLRRCEEYKEIPPVPLGEKWDGVYRMTKK